MRAAIYTPSRNLGELGLRLGWLYVGIYSRRQWARFPVGVFVSLYNGRRRFWLTPFTITRAITRRDLRWLTRH